MKWPAQVLPTLKKLWIYLQNHQIIIFVLTIILIFLVGFLYVAKLIEPTSPPQNVTITNLSDQQATISWVTEKPTRGFVVISESGNFPPLPIFSKSLVKDDGEKLLPTAKFYQAHHVTISNLEPEKTYQFRIYQGWKKMYRGSFTTTSTLTSVSIPSPIYGLVLKSDKKTPVVGALVYVKAKNKTGESGVLSTLTNLEGRWQLDLGNLRTADLKNYFLIGKDTTEEISVEAGKMGQKILRTDPDHDAPAPVIILN